MGKYLGIADYPTESIKCECGLEQLGVTLCSDGDVSFSIMSSFLGKENSIWKSIWNVLKRKEVYYAEVLLTKEKAIQFFEDCIKMIKENDTDNTESENLGEYLNKCVEENDVFTRPMRLSKEESERLLDWIHEGENE